MQLNSRGAKIVLMVLKRQDRNTEEWQIKHSSPAPSAELNSNSTSREDVSVESGNMYVPPNAISETDTDGENNSNKGNCDASNADIETPSFSSTYIYPSLRSTPNTTSFFNTPPPMILTSPLKKGVKRKRNENTWTRNLNKKFKNSGKVKTKCTPQATKSEKREKWNLRVRKRVRCNVP